MQFFETLLTCALGVLAVGMCTRGWLHRCRFRMFLAACGLFLAHLALEIPRWQLGTTYFVGLLLALILLKRNDSRAYLRACGLLIAVLLLANSIWLAWQFPILNLPQPSGPHLVGTTYYSLTDEQREETFADDEFTKREVFVEVWYPAKADNGLPQPGTLWSELYRGRPDQVSIFMSYLRGVRTHSFPSASPDVDSGPFPLIIFNHGLQMFTAQNTLLMEHLASHGYVVVSVGHPYESLRVNLTQAGPVLPPFITSWTRFQQAMAWVEESSAPINEAIAAMKELPTIEDRATVMLDAIEGATVNETIERWVSDCLLVLDDLETNASPHSFRQLIDFDRVGAMGMSVGGAVSVELCKSDKRFRAGINIDGLAYGPHCREELPVPAMMLYSEDGKGLNEFLAMQSKADYYEYLVVGTRHADFTDFGLVWPMMRMVGQVGEIPAARMNAIMARMTQTFLDRYLSERQVVVPTADQIPELRGTARFAP